MMRSVSFVLLVMTMGAFAAPATAQGVRMAQTVHVVSNGWHTGIVVPRKAVVATRVLPEAADFPDAAYLEFGWGDQGFYQADEITTGLTLNAILWPTETVMHVVALPQDISSYFSNFEYLNLNHLPDKLDCATIFAGLW